MTWFSILLVALVVFAYQRASLAVTLFGLFLMLLLKTNSQGLTRINFFTDGIFAVIFLLFSASYLRLRLISGPLLRLYRGKMPSISTTEKEAIAAGTVTWEGELFRGMPDWQKLLALPKPVLSEEEQAFLNGPVETLCNMLNDWEIRHHYADLPAHIWTFLKNQGFFALIIPKSYGGKQFSAYAHSQILTKISAKSITASTTVAVPNSLGPAELLLHYGTEEQKNYYLPRLASGEEIPCFALTSPEAGSDAGSMTDHGIVCYGRYEGKEVLGIRLNWSKRYITLAPIATIIGLAFKLYDPEMLLKHKTNLGITCALIPAQTAGISIGRRHLPLHTPFQNGPIQGKDVFIPLDFVIGGAKQVGHGWRMLMECLAVGRAISLPATAVGGAKAMSFATGAYARVRRQFNLPIGRFEGIEEPLARMTAFTYLMDAARQFVTSAIDSGEKPSVASAIVKYHTTELARKVVCDGMDIHGGKAICLGPRNYIGGGYESSPIAITVEGANILTRNMIIFGQGVMRAHPYVLAEYEAAHLSDARASLIAFDKVMMKHLGFGMSNLVRSLVLCLISCRAVRAPRGKCKRYFQYASRFSAVFALLTDVSMLCLGSEIKRKESLSARLADMISYLYLLSSVLKHYHDQGKPQNDLPLIRFICEFLLYETQEKCEEILNNFPIRAISFVLRLLIFPWGKPFAKPKDHYHHKIAQLMMAPTSTRAYFAQGLCLTGTNDHCLADMEAALIAAIAAEPIEKLIRSANRENQIEGYTLDQQAQSALRRAIITKEEFEIFTQAQILRQKMLAVDDFVPAELTRVFAHETNQHLSAVSKKSKNY